MKKTLSVVLTLVLALGVLAGIGLSAYAAESEVYRLPEINMDNQTYMTLEEAGISDLVDTLRQMFPEKIEHTYENGKLNVQNLNVAASVQFYSYADGNTYEMNLVDGYWTLEIEQSIYEQGGLVEYLGIDSEWEVEYRSGSKERIEIYPDNAYIYIYDNSSYIHYYPEGSEVANSYDIDGNLTENEVWAYFDNGVAEYSLYNKDREFVYAGVCIDDWCYYLPDQGWSLNPSEYTPVDAPAGYEEADENYFKASTPCTIPCAHDWSDATCEKPKTCSDCGETDGEALGHDWSDATCEEPKTCDSCGLTDGEALGHDWTDATTEAPKTCNTCGATDGDPLPTQTNWFMAIINMILDFFRRLFGLA